MKITILSAFALALVVSGAASASAATTAPPLVSDVCSKCHGPDGDSQSPLFPRLAGQTAAYIKTQLESFRDHSRGDPHARAYMWGIAKPLSDDQIGQIAEYYASRKPGAAIAPTDAKLVAQGKQIFFNGDDKRDIPVCASCHGEQAQGNDSIPRLAGQQPDYLYQQLRAFRNGMRYNETMHANVQKMTNEEAAAVSQYLAAQ